MPTNPRRSAAQRPSRAAAELPRCPAADRHDSSELPPASAAAEHPDWAELPLDLLTLIFRKVGGIEVLWRAQAVCRPWRRLAFSPDFWRVIDMRGHSNLFNVINMEVPTRIAVDRSRGYVQELYLDHFGSNDLLRYVADRSSGLRRLVLIRTYVWDQVLVEFVARCPLLEELQIANSYLGDETCKEVGQARPELKCFRLKSIFYKLRNADAAAVYHDYESIEIADSMPQLRELQLIGNQMTNKGLHAILDKCLHLESLDIRACFNVNVDACLRAKLAKIKSVKLPHDSTADYDFVTFRAENMPNKNMPDKVYISGDSESDLDNEGFFDYDSDFIYDDFTVADCFDGDGNNISAFHFWPGPL